MFLLFKLKLLLSHCDTFNQKLITHFNIGHYLIFIIVLIKYNEKL